MSHKMTGMQQFLVAKDPNPKMEGEVHVWCDASAALGIIDRKGFGKTRRIDTGLLWAELGVPARCGDVWWHDPRCSEPAREGGSA